MWEVRRQPDQSKLSGEQGARVLLCPRPVQLYPPKLLTVKATLTKLAHVVAFLVVFAWSARGVEAATATWNPNPEPDIAGYKLSYKANTPGISCLNNVALADVTLDVGNVTSTLVALTPGVTYYFVVQAYNTSGLTSPCSTEVSFTVDAGAPTFTTQPIGQTIIAGQNTSFTVAANGTPTPSFQWQISTNSGVNWTNLTNTATYSGATTTTLTVTTATTGLSGARYRAVASSSAGNVPSNAATLTVNVATPPAITTQPTNQTVTAGGNASFTVLASGAPAPTYQWQMSTDGGVTFANLADVAPYSGATTTTLAITGVTTGLTGYRYRAIAANGVAPNATSSAATLTVNVAPAITTQPTNQTIVAGQNGSFTATATGTPTPSLQWQVSTNGGTSWTNLTNTAPYSGVTTNILTLTAVTIGLNNNQYRLVATNSVASATSAAATLTVNAALGAPVITTQPTNQTVAAGGNASFTAAASGNPAPTLQWQVSTNGGVTFVDLANAAPYSGVTTGTLTITSVTGGLSGNQYRAVATNSVGSTASNAATLTVTVPPAITTQPSNQTVVTGGNASFGVTATGTPTPTLQWQVSTNGGATFSNLTNAAPYSGVTTGTLTITGATAGLTGNQYRAVATNSAGSATSNAATLTVTTGPAITTQPSNQTVAAGANTSFTVAATGSPAPTYQWQISTNGGATFSDLANGAPYSGVTTQTLTLTSVTAPLNGRQYRAVATNSAGTATSNAATLTVVVPPAFTTQPANQTVISGQNASFTVVASGSPAPTYQWQASIDGVVWTNLVSASATTATLTLTATDWWNQKQFRCVATNVGGSATSAAATLTVYGTMTVSPTAVTFSATKTAASATLSNLTPAQSTMTVGFTAQPTGWTATANRTWLQVTNGTGAGAGQFTVQIVNPGNVIGGSTVLSGSITVTATASDNWPVEIPITLLITQTLTAGPDAPFGSFDTPVGATSTVQGSVALSGWALADGSLARVEIWRDPVAGDSTPYQGAGPANGKMFVANATVVGSARPDVEAQFSTDPQAARAGWGYLLETHTLASPGDGSYTVYAIAYDTGGRSTLLGSKTLVVDNAHGTLPFGTLDTPGENAVVAGTITIAGWALTPGGACTIGAGTGAGVWASIDSGPLVPVLYGQARSDIAVRFPGFTNSAGAGGSFALDTTTLANGSHQISWSVSDSCGRQAWIGSRFFDVQNGSAARVAAPSTAVASQAAAVSSSPMMVQQGEGAWSLVSPNAAGVRVAQTDERNRINVQLPAVGGATYTGAHRVGTAWRALPLGSSLDSQTGLFSWEPAAGFVGSYDLAFVSTATDGTTLIVPVRIVVGPSVRLWIDAPPTDVERQQPFELTGWTLDLAAAAGTGIEMVQVQALPAAGGNTILVATTTTDEARAVVAAMFGGQFMNSGFRLLVSGLPAGTYDLIISVHATPSGPLRGSRTVRVSVH